MTTCSFQEPLPLSTTVPQIDVLKGDVASVFLHAKRNVKTWATGGSGTDFVTSREAKKKDATSFDPFQRPGVICCRNSVSDDKINPFP
jgi:hypothetical protein